MFMDSDAHMIDIHIWSTYGYRSRFSEFLELDTATGHWVATATSHRDKWIISKHSSKFCHSESLSCQ